MYCCAVSLSESRLVGATERQACYASCDSETRCRLEVPVKNQRIEGRSTILTKVEPARDTVALTTSVKG